MSMIHQAQLSTISGAAVLAQMGSELSSIEGYLSIISRIGATSVLGICCYILWKQLQREQQHSAESKDEYISALKEVIMSNTEALREVKDVLGNCKDRG